MKIVARYCKICSKNVDWIIGGSVIKKKDNYYITCEKGHISEMFISKDLIKVLKKKIIDNNQ